VSATIRLHNRYHNKITVINGHQQKMVCHSVLYTSILGVLRLEDITAAGDFLGLSDQKSSYKHVSDFGRLRSYGHFLIPVHALE
jgi:hypothetical protein